MWRRATMGAKDVGKCTDKLAWRGVATNVPFVKNTIFTKQNKGKPNKIWKPVFLLKNEWKVRTDCLVLLTSRDTCPVWLRSPIWWELEGLGAQSRDLASFAFSLSLCSRTRALSQAQLRAGASWAFVDWRMQARISVQFSSLSFIIIACNLSCARLLQEAWKERQGCSWRPLF